MNYSVAIMKGNVQKILDEADEKELRDFTYDLFDCLYADIICEKESELHRNTIEAYADEIKKSIEIFNPEMKNDLEMLEKMLVELERYLELF